MHRKLLMSCVSLLVLTGLLGLPGMASASPVMTTSKGAVAPVGTQYKGITIGATVMTVGFNLQCTAGVNSGVLTKNTGTEIQGEIKTLELSGTGAGGDCTSVLGDFKVTTTAGNGVPYCMTTVPKTDNLSIRGGSCSGPARSITYRLDFTGGFTCNYERESPITAPFTTSPTDATATQAEVEFKGEAGNGFQCPQAAKLDASLTLVETATGGQAFVS
jgi:hypothetical protein